MKWNHIISTIALCLVAAIAAIWVKEHSLKITTSSGASAGTASNSVPFVTNRPEVAGAIGKTNTADEGGYSRKFNDPKTGQCAFLSSDKRTLTLKDKGGNVIWTVKLADLKQTDGASDVFTDVNSVTFVENPPVLFIENGIVSCDLDLRTGKIIHVGRRMFLP